MDSGLFYTLAGEEERGRKLYAENLRLFREHLRIAKGNITLPGEAELVSKVQQLEQQFAAVADTFLPEGDPLARRQVYFTELLPIFTQIKNTRPRRF